MNIRTRVAAVALLTAIPVVAGAVASEASTAHPARPFQARYRGAYVMTPPIAAFRPPTPVGQGPAAAFRRPGLIWRRPGLVGASAQRSRTGSPERPPVEGALLSMSGQGQAQVLGASRIAASLTVGPGWTCRPINGTARLSRARSPVMSADRSIKVTLVGSLCEPLEGTASALVGTYTVTDLSIGIAGGSGRFMGRAYIDGTFVLWFKGTI
jgi:hypothetical protein